MGQKKLMAYYNLQFCRETRGNFLQNFGPSHSLNFSPDARIL